MLRDKAKGASKQRKIVACFQYNFYTSPMHSPRYMHITSSTVRMLKSGLYCSQAVVKIENTNTTNSLCGNEKFSAYCTFQLLHAIHVHHARVLYEIDQLLITVRVTKTRC